MAAVVGRDRVSLKETGRDVTVPSNCKARIMYYLDCIFCLLGKEDLPQEVLRLGRYQNYYSLSTVDCVALLALAKELSPDKLVGQVIFPSAELCGSYNNKFYDISVVSTRMVVASSIMIGGQQRRVRKIMAFKESWLRTYYLDAALDLIALIEREQRALPSSRARAPPPRRQNNDSCAIL